MSRVAFRKVVWPIAFAETLVWGGFYYIFAALLLDWEQDLGWSKTQISGALTVAMLTSAFLSPLTGRLIDRGHGKRLFLGSVLFGVVLLLLLSQVTAIWQFYAVWILMGGAVAGALYEPTFAILTKAMGDEAKEAITQVTLAAGFASTICFPLSRVAINLVGWRGATIMWALIVLFLVFPSAWYGLQHANLSASVNRSSTIGHRPSVSSLTRTPLFGLLALAFSMIILNHSGLLTHLLSIFAEKGVSPEVAVLAASLIGPMQVAGRIAMVAAGSRVSTLAVFSACYIAMGVAALILWGATLIPWLIFGFVILQGAGYGVTSIMRPVTTAELMGREHFGAVSGLLAIPFQAASALAPTIAALLWEIGGNYNLVILFSCAAVIVGLFAMRQASRLSL